MSAGTPKQLAETPGDLSFSAIETTFKRAVAALDEEGIPFLLGGSLACWAHGGAETRNDLDLMIKPDDRERAVQALARRGMTREDPPESWLVKVWDGDVLVDLIHHPMGLEITDEVIERGHVKDVAAMRVRVMAPNDILVSKLLALNEHALDLESSLQIARALREQVDWADVAERTSSSPYARAFISLIRELGLDTESPARPRRDRPVVRVVGDEERPAEAAAER